MRWAVLMLVALLGGCAGTPRAGRSSFEDVPYGYAGERSVWSPRSGVWVRMAELEAGRPSSTVAPALLIHPWGTDMRIWRDVAPALARHRRVLLLDLPGHGKSGKPPGAYPVERLAAAALDVLDAAGVGEAVLVGNSIGGATSMALAARAPSRVRAIVVVGAPGGTSMPASVVAAARGATRPRSLATLDDLGWALGWWLLTPSMPPLAQTLRDTTTTLAETSPEHRLWARSAASALAAVATWRAPAEALRMPVLVVHGEDDLVVRREIADALMARLPSARLAVLAGCGHMPQVECPAELLGRVEPFLQGR